MFQKKRSPPCLSPSPSPMWQRCNTSVAIGSISASQLSPTPLAPITWSWSQSNRGIGLRARNTLRYWHWEGTPWPQHCALVLVSLVSTQPPVQLPTVIASHRMKVNGQKNGHHLNLHQKITFDRGGYIKEIHKGCYVLLMPKVCVVVCCWKAEMWCECWEADPLWHTTTILTFRCLQDTPVTAESKL